MKPKRPFLLFLHHKFLRCRHEVLKVLFVNCHLGSQRQRLCFNLLHGLNGNLLLLYSLDALFQFGKFLFAFFSLKFQYAQMLLLLAISFCLEGNR